MNNIKLEVLDRREFVVAASAAGGAAAVLAGLSGSAMAKPEDAAKLIAELTNNAKIAEGKVKVDLPEIAENGNTVPVKVSVDSPMTKEDHVKTVHLVSEGNPAPQVAAFHFTPMSGKANAATRLRLARTQNIVGVAVMSDGKVYMSKTQVKVTIGGCGG